MTAIEGIQRACDAVLALDGHFRVNGRGFKLGMTEQLLNVSNVRAVLEEMGRERMAQRMASG